VTTWAKRSCSSGDLDATKLEGSAVSATLTSAANTLTDLGAFTTAAVSR
jgi:hypothetical protein